MNNKNLLVELFTEELPPKALKKLGEAFATHLFQYLRSLGLTSATSLATGYATPRRLAVHITDVLDHAPDDHQAPKQYMPVGVGINPDGKPSTALLKKATKDGFVDLVEKWPDASEGRGRLYIDEGHIWIEKVLPGADIALGLAFALKDTLAKLPIPKVMFYQRDDGTPVNFVRPAHKLIALHGAEVVNVQALGLKSGRLTQGHRFHSSGDITIADADSYVATLKQHHVVASFAERRASIQAQLNALAKGDEIIAPDALLDEVNSLVEWPRAYECHFEKQFLEVPQECLILTMQTNQKYFAAQRDGKLTNRFLIVSNIETNDASLIIGGNERVVRPRLADAKFFFDQDRKRTLESRVPELAKVVYHNKLGSQRERNERVVAIAREIAIQLGADVTKAERAARLSKADLVTDMVGEFPELQGIMGEYYAKHDGEDVEVAQAIREHYRPRFAGDELPGALTGDIVALADKLETLVGMFGIGALPTGDKDPYALRRHALGVVRLVEKLTSVGLFGGAMPNFNDWLKSSFASFHGYDLIENTLESVYNFVLERWMNLLAPLYGLESVVSVASLSPRMEEFQRRVQAVREFQKLPESLPLAAANKRISNILKKSDSVIGSVDASLLKEDAEKQLHGALKNIAPLADRLFNNHEYTASLRELAVLRGPVDTFFDKVMVNAEDPALRNNRLALLKQLHTAMNRVADLSKLAA
jgi:glycyl-tRNA synthetase beta chain